MSFEMTFLSAEIPMQKQYSLDTNNLLTTKPYPNIKNLTSHVETITSLESFYTHIKEHAKLGHSLLKGNLTRQIVNESRASLADDYALSHWLCFDIDGLPNISDTEEFIQLLPKEFHNVSYITQLSSSMFIQNESFAAHIYFLLKTPQAPDILKDYISYLNISIKYIQEKLTLNPAATTLHRILDPVINQNSRIIYIAPPKLNTKIPNLLDNIKAISLVSKKLTKLNCDFNIPINIAEAEKQFINKLREARGLSSRRTSKLKFVGSLPVEPNPAAAHITSVKESRGFTYLNLNGGDSWGYYYPTDNPEIVRNFKDEPNYYLKDLDPQYYAKLLQATAQGTVKTKEGLIYFGCNDIIKDKYCGIVFNEDRKTIDLHHTNSLVKIKSFLKLNGQPIPDDFPNWLIVHNFSSDTIVDFENRILNLYQPSSYMLNATSIKECPPTILFIISHVMNYDKIAIEHFLNWLAVIVQHRCKTKTAWVFSGTQGTGKNLVTGEILAPILGHDATAIISAADLENDFNGFMERSLLVVVDEIEVEILQSRSKANSNIKRYITEGMFSINKKYLEQKETGNCSNLIFTSNKHDPVIIDDNDRRFNIAPRQQQKLKDVCNIDEIDDLVATELQDFASYLMTRIASKKIAKIALENDEKERLTELTQDSNETILKEMVNGNLEFFISNKPDIVTATDFAIASKCAEAPSFDVLIEEAIASKGELVNIPRLHIQAYLYYISGVSFRTPHKCSKFLAQKGYQTKVIRYKSLTDPHAKTISTRGLQDISWNIPNELIQHWRENK